MPRRVARGISLLVGAAWVLTMGVLLNRAYVQARGFNLATDLAGYGSAAEWRGVYYRGEKIGFTVSQTNPGPDGVEVREDARLRMSLLGATTAATIRTSAQLDRAFALRSFEFSLDPGTGPVQVAGRVSGKHVSLRIKTPSGTQAEERDLPDVPVLSLNLPRRLAAQGFKPGSAQQVVVFDPATLASETVTIAVGKREIVNVYAPAIVTVGSQRVGSHTSRPIPAFKVEMAFAGLRTSAWVTDTGEVVREESPLGYLTVRESPEDAQRLAIGGRIQGDLLESAAVQPRRSTKNRIDDPRDVRRIRIRIDGADLQSPEMRGAGQSVDGDVLQIVDARSLRAEPADPDVARYLRPEPFIESDDPAIRAEAEAAVAGVADPCNEHTALYVAMARAVGIPARIAVGLAYSRGAFYYHAWPEVYIDEGRGRGLWLPVDPTFNQFPADATHVRMTRGGLDRQAAILPLIGHIKMNIIDLELAPNSTPILVGRGSIDAGPLSVPFPVRAGMTCWASPSSTR